MSLISECLHVDPGVMASCLVNPGSGAAPGGSWASVPAADCSIYDPAAMIECLTDGSDLECCFVAGINGCVILIDGQPVIIT